MIWKFDEYVEESGRAPYSEWVASVPEAVDFVDTRLLNMMAMRLWPEKWATKYKGVKIDLFELRVTFNKVQYRPLGVYAPGFRFILFGGAKEKGEIPRHTIDAVVERISLFKRGVGHARRYRFNQK